jgi:dihydrofolate synthase/folylpolyglutamate synthase
VNDKDLEEILFPKNAIYFSKPNNPRGLDATILAEKKSKRPDRAVFNSITAAYQKPLKHLRILTSYTLAAVPL